MSVGSLLTQPQRLPRLAAAKSGDAGLGDLAKLAIGVAIDTAKGGHILEAFEAAGEAAGERFLAQAEHGVGHAKERLGAMLEAPLAGLATKAQELGAVDGPDAALAAAHDILTTVVALASELTIDHIRQHLAELLDIIETDFGLTPTFLETELWAFLDDFVERLEHVSPESDASLRSNRLQVIAALRQLKRTAVDEFHFPQLPVEQLAEELFALIQSTGITSEAARVACVGANLVQVADAGRDLLHAVPFTGLGSGSIGAGTVPDPPAATDVYLWYPSWLANNHRPVWTTLLGVIPNDQVVKTVSQEIVQRNTWRADSLIATATSDWAQVRKVDDSTTVPYSFGTVSAESMETIAWVSSIAANGFELLFHLISLEEGDYASNIVNGLGATGYGTWKALKREPAPWWLEGLLVRTLGTFGASFEGVHTKAAFGLCFKEWLTLAGPDYAEMLSYKYFTNVARDLLLCSLTLMNHKAPDTDGTAHPRNREEIDAIRHIFVMGLHNLVLLIGFDRKNWGLLKPGGDYSPMASFFLLWGVLMGTIVGFLGGLIGSIIGELLSRDPDASPVENKLWWGIPQAIFLGPYWLYLQQEGHTSGGTFNPVGPSDFLGYPKPASGSPYKLPYDSSAVGSCYVGQANEGLFSHNFNNVDQIYAYDFSLDKNDEILAARSGTVVAFFEGVPDDQTGGAWNYIAIQHDVDNTGAPVGPNAHDQGPGGGLIKTVAVYGHGRNGSVSAAFARHVPPVPTAGILNSKVKQGMPIMDAGCTGISFHNHLHMHVVPAPVGGGGTGNTIPFVFSDPDTGGDGTPTHFNFYTSANVRRTS